MQPRRAALALISVLASSCAPAGSAAGPQRFSVKVDGKSEEFPIATTAFFPADVAIHAGDTIDFEVVFTGEPHTVTFGTLVDDAVEVISDLPQGRALSDEDLEDLEESLEKVPDLFPLADPNRGVSQGSAQPCFLMKGAPDAAKPCRQIAQPKFSGKETFYNSGWLSEDEVFTVEFARGIEEGTYNFMCMVHRETMTGRVNVVSPAADVEDAGQLAERADAELRDRVAGLEPAALAASIAEPEDAVAGGVGRGVFDAFFVAFGPRDARVVSGETVSWAVRGFHTIALNPPEQAVGLLQRDAGGRVTLNPLARRPSRAPPSPAAFAEEPRRVRASYDGAGFFNSGFLLSFVPGFVTYDLRFTRPGTYELQCLVHPDMEGRVRVAAAA